MSINDLLESDIFLPILLILIGAVLSYFGIVSWASLQQKRNQDEIERQKPITEVQAKLISNQPSSQAYLKNFMNELIFETEDKNRLIFTVQKNDASLLVAGDVGILKYQGTMFNSFTRE